jgi:hypothetical protein
MHRGLDPDHMSLHLMLEGHLPGRQTRGLMVEDEAISLLPNDPSTSHEDIHKQGLGESRLSNVKLLMDIGIVVPSDANSKPPTSSRREIKKEVLHSFFSTLVVENAIVTIIKMLLPSS